MTEQLDLFVESAKEEQEKPKTNLTTRQWCLLNLIKRNSFENNRKTTQSEICAYIVGYEWNDDEKCHDHCPAIWNDIKDINLSYDTDKVIISKNFEYWIGNEKETKEFIDRLWSDLEPRLVRYWAYLKKIERNGQGLLLSRRLEPIGEDSKARRFIESYGEKAIGD